MPMKNPPHPGEIIRDLTIEPLELTVTQAAAGLGASRYRLSFGYELQNSCSSKLPGPYGQAGKLWLAM